MTGPVILGFSGSLRQASSSLAVLATIAEAVSDRANVRIVPLHDVPLYNADHDGDDKPSVVVELKRSVAEADGLIFVVPEYNYGIPGVLKNAIDWVSRPAYASPLKGKPALTMSCSVAVTGGVRVHQHMRDTLAATLSRPIARAEVVIPVVHQKIANGRLVDDASLTFAVSAVDDLLAEIALLAQHKRLAEEVA